jgi:hypothetical protein
VVVCRRRLGGGGVGQALEAVGCGVRPEELLAQQPTSLG